MERQRTGVLRSRVVAVLAKFSADREQWGSGYLIDGRLVLTAAHCVRDHQSSKADPLPGISYPLRVIRASDGKSASVIEVVASPALDVAVLRLDDAAPWNSDLPAPTYGRVDRSRTGILRDCEAVGYPLMQRNPSKKSRVTAELHGMIYNTDEEESGRLLMREPLIDPGPVTDPGADPTGNLGHKHPSPWGGLSGALVFCSGYAIGVVTEHHPRQGDSALLIVAFDKIAKRATKDDAARRVAEVLSLPEEKLLAWVSTIPAAEAAAAMLEEAKALSLDGEFEAAELKCEKAVDLAEQSEDNEIRIRAHLEASRAYGGQGGLTVDDARLDLLEKMVSHVDAAAALGARPVAVASERLLIARLGTSQQEVLYRADELARIADPGDTSSQVDVVCARLEALIDADRPDEAFALGGEVERLRQLVDTEERLTLDATWLLSRMSRSTADPAQRPVASFTADVRQSVEQGAIAPKRGETILRTVAEGAGQLGRFDDALTVMREAYEIAKSPEDPGPPRAMMARMTAKLAALTGNAQLTHDYLGEVALWWPRAISASSRTAEREAGIRVKVLSSRGDILALLAERLADDRKASEAALLEAYEAYVLARKLAEQHWAALAPELDIDVFVAYLAWRLGGITQNLGRSDEAVHWFRSVRTDSAMADATFAFECGMPAWLREAESLRLAGRTREAREVVAQLLCDVTDDKRPEEISSRARAFLAYLDDRELPTIEWLESPQAAVTSEPPRNEPLRDTVARAVAELVSSWEQWRGFDYPALMRRFFTSSGSDDTYHSDLQSVLMDAWGRGGFLNVAAAVRAKPLSAIAVDARSVAQIASWARILCPIYDTVIIKWKGSLGGEFTLVPVPQDIDFAGGSGFRWVSTPRSLLDEGFAAAAGWSNPVPAQVSQFLSGPALGLVRAGRLIVLPAALVGCTQYPVGWTDDLLVSGLLSGVLSIGREDRGSGEMPVPAQPMLDLSTFRIPFIDDISMPDLAAVLDEATEWTRLLYRTLFQPLGEKGTPLQDTVRRTIVEGQIVDACRQLEERFEALARKDKKGNWRVKHVSGTMSARTRPSANPGQEPVTEVLRSIAPLPADVAPWAPFWLLERRGGRLSWTAPLANSAKQPEPEENPSQELYSWLWPPTGGRLGTRLVRFEPVDLRVSPATPSPPRPAPLRRHSPHELDLTLATFLLKILDFRFRRRDRPDRASPRKTKKAGSFRRRGDREARMTRVTRRIELASAVISVMPPPPVPVVRGGFEAGEQVGEVGDLVVLRVHPRVTRRWQPRGGSRRGSCGAGWCVPLRGRPLVRRCGLAGPGCRLRPGWPGRRVAGCGGSAHRCGS